MAAVHLYSLRRQKQGGLQNLKAGGAMLYLLYEQKMLLQLCDQLNLGRHSAGNH